MNYFKTLIGLFFLTATSTDVFAQEDRAVVLMYGDSITYGIGVLPRNGSGNAGNGGNFGPSVSELERLLNESRRNSLVLNWGAGGTTSVYGAEYIESSIDTSLNQHTASQYFILIQYGTNDLSSNDYSSTTTEAAIRFMINAAIEKGVTPLLSKLTPRSDKDVGPLNIIIDTIAQDMTVPLVDNFSTLTSFKTFFVYEPSYNDPDEFYYLHPNQMGYDKLAMNWFNDLQTLIMPLPLPPPPPIIAPIMFLLLDND
ncbi:MAG: lysophospholipase L1-like esterase [Arenicella sp.]|jgi:lysophospholipase L1-like esterase